INLIVTVINMRAPGMSLMRMPIFVWMSLVSQFLLLFAIPVITVALFLLSFDRLFSTNFFNVAAGADPLLWQHLFWLFGHPEVYILILPAMGIVSEVLPVFSRKPLFGYQVMVFSGIAIGFMGWGVWAHHMFVTGLGPVATSAFAASTMFIAVPTGVKIFNWIATMWRGKLTFATPMMFAIGFVAMFTIGGLSGVTHGVVPHDTQQTDTYYIVAHFHYVLFGGSMFGLFAAIYYWYPKFFGRLLNERLGKLHFWLMFLGFNLTFGPFHILGLQGMPRRVYTYPEGMGWDVWNFVSTIGSFIIGVSVLVFMYNVWMSRKQPEVGPDPWDARTLEWTIPSPPPEYNFKEIPLVTSRDEHWHRKYTEDEHGRSVRRAVTEEQPRLEGTEVEPSGEAHEGPEHVGSHADTEARDHEGHEEHEPHIHMPSPSYWPIFTSIGLAIISYGMIYKVWIVAVLGGLWTVAGLYAWALEPATAPEDTPVHGPDTSGDDVEAVPA
ncbi:MAG: cbb3-type cytochrome c oxidase subunit I, partial [Actinomycetota bacterium]|nr:cbb3-type cytochrome c oxidase subunit I [Actinomycetota bacterium]